MTSSVSFARGCQRLEGSWPSSESTVRANRVTISSSCHGRVSFSGRQIPTARRCRPCAAAELRMPHRLMHHDFNWVRHVHCCGWDWLQAMISWLSRKAGSVAACRYAVTVRGWCRLDSLSTLSQLQQARQQLSWLLLKLPHLMDVRSLTQQSRLVVRSLRRYSMHGLALSSAFSIGCMYLAVCSESVAHCGRVFVVCT